MKIRKIGVIDHVGIKSGMDCYDLGLLRGLGDQGIRTYLFSNISSEKFSNPKTYHFFESQKRSNFRSLINFVWAHLCSYVMCRVLGVQTVILHLFSTTRKEWLQYRLARLFGLQVITIVHDVNGFLNQDDEQLKAFIYGVSSYLVVHNQFSLSCIKEHLSLSDQEKVHVIPHGHYLDFIGNPTSKSDARTQLGLEQDIKYLLFFGQIKTVKGLDLAVQALNDLPEDVHLIITGKPQKFDYGSIEDLIERLSLQGRVHEQIRFIRNDERDLYFRAADLLVLPYRQIYQSGVLLMAMSYGLPIIASDLPANCEIIEHGKNGLLFKTDDYADLSQKIGDCVHKEELLLHLQRSSFEDVRSKFGWDHIALEYIKLMS